LRVTEPARVLDRAHPPRLAKAVGDQPVGAHSAKAVRLDTRLGVVLFRQGDDFADLGVAEKYARVAGE
jgi:hypothetical protein